MNPPHFPIDALWLNTDRPFGFPELKGHIVLLDFWTYGCINCLHILPILKRLEEKYKKEPFIIIGIHSAKFPNEQIENHIQSAIERYKIDHPVLVDSEHSYWKACAVKAWPSFMLIDAEGKIKQTFSGEMGYELLDSLINDLISEAKDKKTITNKKIVWKKPETPDSLLKFPSKLFLNDKNLFVTNSYHHQIIHLNLIAPDAAKVVSKIGDNSILKNPQAMTYCNNSQKFYVCDSGNHQIQILNQSCQFEKSIDLNFKSPMDLLIENSSLFIACAGSHQIVEIDLLTHQIINMIGSGIEGLQDGNHSDCQLAQPSSLSSDGQNIYFCDAESSSIRFFDKKNRQVQTLLGKGLFDYGHIDGLETEARLQHPQGIFYWKEMLFIADTYNHSLRAYDIQSKQLMTMIYPDEDQDRCLVGDDECSKLTLFEPNDVVVLETQESPPIIYLADTNNHLIRGFDLKTQELFELEIIE